MKQSKSHFEKVLDGICRSYGYPNIKLDYYQYQAALKETHRIVYGTKLKQPLNLEALFDAIRFDWCEHWSSMLQENFVSHLN